MDLNQELRRDVYQTMDAQLDLLTGETSLYRAATRVGAVFHLRSGYLGPQELLQVENCDIVTIYADTLVLPSRWKLGSDVETLDIFARRMIIEDGQKLEIATTQDLILSLWCPDIPSGITINHKGKKYPLKSHENVLGSQFVIEDGELSDEALKKPPSEYLNVPSLLDMVKDGGRLADLGLDRMNNNLVRLLEYQLLVAASCQDRHPDISYDCAAFVLNLTAGVPKVLDIEVRASTFAAARVIQNDETIATQVPHYDISQTRAILQARVQAVTVFESAFQAFQSQKANADNIKLFAQVALSAAIDSAEMYDFLSEMTLKRYSEAQKSLSVAQKHFIGLKDDIPAKQKAFEKGVEAYKAKTLGEAIWKGLLAIAGVAAGIAAAAVAPPAGAGIIAGAVKEGADATKGASEAAKIIKKLADIIKKLEETLKKIDKMVTTIQDAIKLIKKIQKSQSTDKDMFTKIKMPTEKGDDTINLTADWEIFDMEMNDLYDSIKEEGIGGASAYFILIRQMTLRGKSVLAAQQAVTVAGDAYMTTVVQGVAQKSQVRRLQEAIPNIQGNEKSLQIMKADLAQRLVGLRASIALDFKQYLNAYAWYALSTERPIILDPFKSISAMAADASTLQAAMSQNVSAMLAQTRHFHLSVGQANSTDAVINRGAKGPLEMLKEDGAMSFALDPTSNIFSNFSRIRLISFRLYLTGAAAKVEHVRADVAFGSEMQDLLPPFLSPFSKVPANGAESDDDKAEVGNPAAFAQARPLADTLTARLVSFITEKQHCSFEYAAEGREVIMEGRFNRSQMSTAVLSPFRTWHVGFAGGVETTKDASGFELELECEVTTF